MEAQYTILAETLATRVSRGCGRDRAQLLLSAPFAAVSGSRGRVSHADSNLKWDGAVRTMVACIPLEDGRRFPLKTNARTPRGVRIACAGRYSFTTSICLFDHLAGEAVDCHMHPVMLLAFNNGIVVQAGCIWFEGARLSDHIDQQVSRCVFGKQRLSPAESLLVAVVRGSVEARL
jgi:hypothetical protein